MSEVSPELVERMVKVIRAHTAGNAGTHFGPNRDRSVFAEMLAIVTEVPRAADPDWQEAKRLTAEEYPHASSQNEHALWTMALLGLKRGRELAGHPA